MSSTVQLVDGLIELWNDGIPQHVSHHAACSLANVVGTAIGASRSDGVATLLRYAHAHGGDARAPVLGRNERVGVADSALLAGFAAHLDDFDDTHLETVIHPGAACLGAVVALAIEERTTGAEALRAFALGCETQLRVGLAISPSHYDVGWHITGTCGPVGAAVTAGLLLQLDADALVNAVGLAASQTLGLREAFGTHTKPFHAGKAAANGVISALLAAEGMTAPPDALDAPNGFQAVLSAEPPHELERQVAGLGESWELERNTFKPYPCGIVSHPAIDAAIAAHARIGDAAVRDVEVICHPLVPELTGNPDPKDGLEGRFSTIHGVAAGLLMGKVGLEEYAPAFVVSDPLRTIRDRVRLVPHAEMARDAATLVVIAGDGQRIVEKVAHARGSLRRPLTDEELAAKVDRLIDPVLPGAGPAIRAAVHGLPAAPDLSQLIRCSIPDGAPA